MHYISEPLSTTGELTGAQRDESDEPLRQLDAWVRSKANLSFVYSRSKGGLLQVGRATIVARTEDVLELNAPGSKLIVIIRKASFGNEPQLFFSNGFASSFYVAGVSVKLENHDWLFMSASANPEALSCSSKGGQGG